MSETAYAPMQPRETRFINLGRRQEIVNHITRQQAVLEIKMILASGAIVTGAILMLSMLA